MAVSASKPFHLVSLPYVILEHVTKQMHIIEKIQLILCSKKAKKFLLERLRLKMWNIEFKYYEKVSYVRVMVENDPHHCAFEWRVTTEEIDKSDAHKQCREPIEPIFIGGKLFEKNSQISGADRMYTVVPEEDRLSSLQLIYDFLCTVFRRTTKYCFTTLLNISFKAFPKLEDLFEWEQTKKFTTLTLKDARREDVAYVLDRVENVESLYIDGDFHGTVYHEKFLTIPSLYMADFSSISKDVLLKRNCKNTAIGGDIVMESADMIEYINTWKAGGNAKVRSLKVSVADTELDRFHADLLAAFKWTKYPANSEPKYFRGQLEVFNLHCGHYLEGPAEKRMTMLYAEKDYIWFFVWIGSTPEFSVPRGKQMYKDSEFEEYGFILPLKPQVFETEEAALMAERLEWKYNDAYL